MEKRIKRHDLIGMIQHGFSTTEATAAELADKQPDCHCEEKDIEIERLGKVIAWVVNDYAYKAPEQINAIMIECWMNKLKQALKERE